MDTRSKISKPRKLIQSIDRAADILALFIREKKTLGIADFASALQLPKTTVQGIVNTLLARNYLEKDPLSSRYRLGPVLFQLGMKYATNMDLARISRAWMERLCFQFKEPVNMGTLVGDNVTIVLRIEPENRFMLLPQTGSVIPLHTTCIGKILFAFLDENHKKRILSDYDFKALTPNSITDRDVFDEELAQVRKSGISFDNQENIIGLAGIGGPVRNHTGRVIASFAITGNASNILEKKIEMIEAVRYTSEFVSLQFGYRSKHEHQ